MFLEFGGSGGGVVQIDSVNAGLAGVGPMLEHEHWSVHELQGLESVEALPWLIGVCELAGGIERGIPGGDALDPALLGPAFHSLDALERPEDRVWQEYCRVDDRSELKFVV